MDIKYQVFVSSTFADLEVEHQKAIKTIIEMDHIPCGMELFPAIDDEIWLYIQKIIDDCDYYLLIVGGRYGTLTPEGISYTEKEYDYAVSKNIKTIVFLHNDPDELPAKKTDGHPDFKKKLEDFRSKISSGRLVRYWKEPADLTGLISVSLSKTIKKYPAVGWIRANSLKDSQKHFDEENDVHSLTEPSDFRKRVGNSITLLNADATFESMQPSYILNASDHVILDWNPSFELVFPCNKYRRGDVIDRWIDCLDNSKDVGNRNKKLLEKKVLSPEPDHETILFTSPIYGRIKFTKSAVQICSLRTGSLVEWLVSLNIDSIEHREKYLKDLDQTIKEYQHWRIYATSYDPILNVFDPYQDLITQHFEAVKTCGNRILDLGAGTGNLTLELLKNGKDVCAVDYSDAMLKRLRLKCRKFDKHLLVFKQDIESLHFSPLKGEVGRYDGIMLLNVLFALRCPKKCLGECYKALSSGGKIVFSGPKKGIPLNRLLDQIADYLRKHNLWQSLRDRFEVVRHRNTFLSDASLLRQYSVSEIEAMVESVGFSIDSLDEGGYAGDDMVVVASKH